MPIGPPGGEARHLLPGLHLLRVSQRPNRERCHHSWRHLTVAQQQACPQPFFSENPSLVQKPCPSLRDCDQGRGIDQAIGQHEVAVPRDGMFSARNQAETLRRSVPLKALELRVPRLKTTNPTNQPLLRDQSGRLFAALHELEVPQRETANRLAGRRVDGVEDGGSHHGNRRLADPAPEVERRDDDRLDLRHFG